MATHAKDAKPGLRNNPRHQAIVREKIRASLLINRLQDHAMGKIELSVSQVQSIKILLDKVLSNAPTDVNFEGHSDIDVSVKFV